LLPYQTLQIKITQPGLIYRLGKGIGAIKVLGLADTGKKADGGAGIIYDNCYLEGGCCGVGCCADVCILRFRAGWRQHHLQQLRPGGCGQGGVFCWRLHVEAEGGAGRVPCDGRSQEVCVVGGGMCRNQLPSSTKARTISLTKA